MLNGRFCMKRIHILTVMSFVFLGVILNSFAASESGVSAAAIEAESVAAVEVATPEVSAGPEIVVAREMEAVQEGGAVAEPGAAVESKEALEERLIDAIRANNLSEVQRLLDMGAPAEERALHVANWSTPLDAPADITRVLIAAGADVNAVNKRRKPVFIDCIGNHSADGVRAFISAGADVNICDRSGDPALLSAMHGACRNRRYGNAQWEANCLAIARVLILAGAYEGFDSDIQESFVYMAGELSKEEWLRKALADRELYVSRLNGLATVLNDFSPLLAELTDIVKDYEVDEEFAFVREREAELKKKAQAAALRYRTLIRYLGQSLQKAYPLMDIVLEYAAEIPVTALAQAGEAEEDEKEQAQ